MTPGSRELQLVDSASPACVVLSLTVSSIQWHLRIIIGNQVLSLSISSFEMSSLEVQCENASIELRALIGHCTREGGSLCQN